MCAGCGRHTGNCNAILDKTAGKAHNQNEKGKGVFEELSEDIPALFVSWEDTFCDGKSPSSRIIICKRKVWGAYA
jgi:hypothetical protein